MRRLPRARQEGAGKVARRQARRFGQLLHRDALGQMHADVVLHPAPGRRRQPAARTRAGPVAQARIPAQQMDAQDREPGIDAFVHREAAALQLVADRAAHGQRPRIHATKPGRVKLEAVRAELRTGQRLQPGRRQAGQHVFLRRFPLGRQIRPHGNQLDRTHGRGPRHHPVAVERHVACRLRTQQNQRQVPLRLEPDRVRPDARMAHCAVFGFELSAPVLRNRLQHHHFPSPARRAAPVSHRPYRRCARDATTVDF